MTGNRLNGELRTDNGESVCRTLQSVRPAGLALSGNRPNGSKGFVQLVFSGVLLVTAVGCNRSETVVVEKPSFQVAYDQKSKQAYLVDGSIELPAAHPTVPKSQLQPAMFCSKCGKWYPLPPIEQLNRNPGAATCPKDQQLLTPEGLLPEKRMDIATGEIK